MYSSQARSMGVTAWAHLAFLAVLGTVYGQDPTCEPATLRLGAAAGVAGEQVSVDIIGSVACDITGFSLGVGHDPAVVRFIGSTPGFFITDHAGSDLVYSSIESNDEGFATVYCLFDISAPVTVPPVPIPADTVLGTLKYEILANAPLGETVLLNRTRTFGSPNPIANVYSGPPGHSPIDPELSDGSILVEEEPEVEIPIDGDVYLAIAAIEETTLVASVRFSAPHAAITAVGTRLGYDPSVLMITAPQDIELSSSLPGSWSAALSDITTPGEIDLIVAEDPLSPESLAGPLEEFEVARIRFSIQGPCPDERSLSFNEDPQIPAAFPVPRFVRYLDPSDTEARISAARARVLGSRWTLRIYDEDSSKLNAALELTAVQDRVAAAGIRIEYDDTRLELASPSDVARGADAPDSWQKVYTKLEPGRIDVVLTDITEAAATISGPIEGAELLTLQFNVLDSGERPGSEAFAFNMVPPVDPEELAAFPGGENQFFEYVDHRVLRVCHLPVSDLRIVETPVETSVDALACLRLPNTIIDASSLPIGVELSSDAASTTALGIRLTYDPSKFSIADDPSKVSVASSLAGTWSLVHFDASLIGFVDFVIAADSPEAGGIPGPVGSLEVATITMRRTAVDPRASDLGFVATDSPSWTPSSLFPYPQFIRYACGCPDVELTAQTRTCVLEAINGFVRSDCNADRRIDISDPIWLLSYLFRGGAASPCAEACNANSDTRLDISDAIHMVTYQFRGGPAPAPPFPGCDQSPFCAVDICP